MEGEGWLSGVLHHYARTWTRQDFSLRPLTGNRTAHWYASHRASTAIQSNSADYSRSNNTDSQQTLALPVLQSTDQKDPQSFTYIDRQFCAKYSSYFPPVFNFISVKNKCINHKERPHWWKPYITRLLLEGTASICESHTFRMTNKGRAVGTRQKAVLRQRDRGIKLTQVSQRTIKSSGGALGH